MRHNKAINHLGRKSGHRKALLANMATSLILHKRIQTTVAKAKALKMWITVLLLIVRDIRCPEIRFCWAAVSLFQTGKKF